MANYPVLDGAGATIIANEKDPAYDLDTNYPVLDGEGGVVVSRKYDIGIDYGPELVANMQFNRSDVWTLGTGWSIAAGRATHTGAGGDIKQTVTGLETGKTYEVNAVLDATGDVSLSNTSVQIRNSANSVSLNQVLHGDMTPNAVNELSFTFVATETSHVVRCYSADDVSLNSFSVREVL